MKKTDRDEVLARCKIITDHLRERAGNAGDAEPFERALIAHMEDTIDMRVLSPVYETADSIQDLKTYLENEAIALGAIGEDSR